MVDMVSGGSHLPLRIAMIGAGSIGFTRRLMRDILAVPELADTTFAFADISQRNLDMVSQLCLRDIEHNKLPARIEPTLDRRQAWIGSPRVVSSASALLSLFA